MKTKYQIAFDDDWITCSKAVPVKRGCLHYEFRDGVTGIALPGKWRLKPDKSAATREEK